MNPPYNNSPVMVLAIYSGLIILASLAGGWLPLAARLTHKRLQVAISFVAGFMLGVGSLHLLPHAFHQTHSIDRTVAWLLAGFLVMFLMQRFFHFHHHDVPDEAEECGHDHHDSHDHHHGHSLAEQSAKRLSWTGAAIGLTFHSLIDGIALAASVQAEPGGEGVWARGVGAFMVILLHKPFDAMAISTLMAAGGRSRYSCHLVNGLFALAIPLGVLLFHLGAGGPPFMIARVEDLRHGAPTHVTHERRLFVGCRGADLGLQLSQGMDRLDVLPIFLARRPFADPVGV